MVSHICRQPWQCSGKILAGSRPFLQAVENTIMAYRDTFIQMLHFIENTKKKKPDKLTLADFNFQLIVDFLDWLEKEKHNSISTRNQRLAAIRAFAKYARSRYPEFMHELQKISDIRTCQT